MRRRISLPALFAITALCNLAIAEASAAYDDYDARLIETSTQESLAYQSAKGQYCREYQKTVTIGGREERAYGTACRMPDGHWQIVGKTRVAPPATVIYRDRVVYEPVYAPAPRPYYDPWWGPLHVAAAVVPLALHIGLDHHGHHSGYYRSGYRGGYHRGGHFRGHHSRRGRHRR